MLLPLLATAVLALAPQAAPASGPPPPQGAAPAQPPQAAPVVPAPQADTAGCAETEGLYARGFDALTYGRDAEAVEALEYVASRCPTHPFAAELARLARARAVLAGVDLDPAPGGSLRRAAPAEATTRAARAELVVVQTLHGMTQGLLLCAAADCDGSQTVAGAALAGAGVGAGVSLLASRAGVRPGQALAVNSGSAWGLYYGAMGSELFDTQSDNDPMTAAVSGLAFTGAGALVGYLARPTAGQVSMVNSGGLWATVVASLLLETDDSLDASQSAGLRMAATTGGLVGLGVLARSEPQSRSRMLFIDAGGVLGGLLGAATVLLLDQDAGDALLVGASVGIGAGLGTAAVLTREVDVPELPEEAGGLSAAPFVGRGGGGLAVGGRF